MTLSRLGYRKLIYALISEIKLISDLFKNNQKYKHLLQELNKYDVDDKEPLPYQKDLLKSLEVSRTQLMDQLNELYNEFSKKLGQPNAYKITETEIWLLIKTQNDYWIVGIDKLETIPKKGERFMIPFIRDEFGSSHTTVENVDHEITRGKHVINIHLNNSLNKE